MWPADRATADHQQHVDRLRRARRPDRGGRYRIGPAEFFMLRSEAEILDFEARDTTARPWAYA
jgi:hypothetical protein